MKSSFVCKNKNIFLKQQCSVPIKYGFPVGDARISTGQCPALEGCCPLFLQTFVGHRVNICKTEGYKRCPFTRQKGMYYWTKGALLHGKRAQIALIKDMSCINKAGAYRLKTNLEGVCVVLIMIVYLPFVVVADRLYNGESQPVSLLAILCPVET